MKLHDYSRHAYFTTYDFQDGRERFVQVISNSLACFKLSCQATKSQLNRYMMQKMDQYFMGPQCTKKLKSARNVGQQPKSTTWVFNDKFTYTLQADSAAVDDEATEYVWLGDKYYGKESDFIAASSLTSSAVPLKQGSMPLNISH